jgi:Zn finger protein HypA/HybF involved in hydrogenase expression
MRGRIVGTLRCPSCDNEFNAEPLILAQDELSLLEEELHCPICSAMIKISNGYKILADLKWVAFGYALFFGLILFCVLSCFAPEAGVDSLGIGYLAIACLIVIGICISVVEIASVKLRRTNMWEVAGMRRTCQCCGGLLTPEDTELCPSCGATLYTVIVSEVTISHDVVDSRAVHKASKSEPVGTCLVCDLDMHSADALVLCPHCSNVFHKSHLIQWVRLKKRCPACGEHLYESEIKELPPHAVFTNKSAKEDMSEAFAPVIS